MHKNKFNSKNVKYNTKVWMALGKTKQNKNNCRCFVCMFVHTCVLGTQGSQKRVSDPLGLELQVVVGAGNRVSGRAASEVNC